MQDTVSYTYGDSAWGDLLTAWDGQTITYDGIGNPTSDGTWNYTWEHGRELASMTSDGTTWTYTYNADGLRTSRTNGSTTYEYIYTGSQLTQMTMNENGTLRTMYFIYDASGPIAIKMTNGTSSTTYYYVKNIQGDIIAIVNKAGTAVVTYTYDAWGNILSIGGEYKNGLGVRNPLRYRGYVYDTETQFYYLQSRYYDPEVGRFINADVFTSTGQGILGNNMFAYCLNNPANYLDSDGKDAIWIHEEDSAFGFGHSGLLVQDKDENWYFFYWGPVNESAGIKEIIDMITTGVPSNCVLVYIDTVLETRTTDGVQVLLRESDNEFVAARADLITDIRYFEGDYTDTLNYLRKLEAEASTNDYHLLNNNCVQNTWKALAVSDERFRYNDCPVIPNWAYFRMVHVTHFDY